MANKQIIILGANPASEALVATLNRYGHQIVLIDNHSTELRKLSSKYDISSINDNPSYPKALLAADLNAAHALIALTHSDETNFIACHIAKSYCTDINCLISLKSHHYEWDGVKPKYAEPINNTLSHNQSIYEDIQYIIDNPAFTHINTLSHGFTAATLGISEEYKYYNLTLEELKKSLPKTITIAGLRRQQAWVKFRKNIKISKNDQLLFISKPDMLSKLPPQQTVQHPIVILGISHFTEYLCHKLQHTHILTIIEQDKQLCETLAMSFPNITILNNDPLDEITLNRSQLHTSLVIACSKDDEDNLINAFQSVEYGAIKVFSLINHLRQGHVFDKTPIDYMINTPQIICDEVIRNLLKSSHIDHFYTKSNFIQIAELNVTKDHHYCNLAIKDISLPSDIFIGCIIRDETLIFTEKTSVIQPGDIIVLYGNHIKNDTNTLEEMFLTTKNLVI